MKALCLVLAVLAGAASPGPSLSYSPQDPFQLALRADLIVDAVVVDFDDGKTVWEWLGGESSPSTLTLDVRDVVAGKVAKGQLTSLAFEDWTCHSRYASYAKGQRAIFFLQYRSKDGVLRRDQPPAVMGAGNEGECPVVRGDVYHRGARLTGFKRVTIKAFGHKYIGLRSPLREFLAAVRGVRRCYEWKGVPGKYYTEYPIDGLGQTCTDEELTEYTASSKLALAMVRDTSSLKRAEQAAKK